MLWEVFTQKIDALENPESELLAFNISLLVGIILGLIALGMSYNFIEHLFEIITGVFR